MPSEPPGSWPAMEDNQDQQHQFTIPAVHQDLDEQGELGTGEQGKKKSIIAEKRDIRFWAMLPAEIRETILYLVDPETFASLVLVDRKWRSASQTPHLYAHHLSRCPSFSRSHNVIGGPFTEDSLVELKRDFAREVKRNLFEAYLQPRRTLVSLVSTTTSSSAAFPGGEAFDFSFSPNGHWVLALSSSRIYVLDTVSPKVSVQRELKVVRRPVAAAILDDGSILAVLSSDHQVNTYSLVDLSVKHLRSISLDNPPHAIALAPKGEVLAAAYDGGIEVHSLAPNAQGTDHRAIKCDRVDALKFSSDGTMLLGSTKCSKSPNTVVLSAPCYTDDQQDLPPSDQISHLWTSQILFPNSSRDCSNATLLPNRSDGDANWTFTYDKVFESFRTVRTDDLRNGTTYFTGPKPPSRDKSRSTRRRLIPCTFPASSDRGELVAAGFLGNEIWLYGVPEGLDTSTVMQTDEINSLSGSSAGPSTPSIGPRTPARSFTRGEAAEMARLPKWQILVDKYRNVFAKGRRVAEISGVSNLCWVSRKHETGPRSLGERLIIAAPGGIPGDPELEQDGFASVDGGRLVILDFDRTVTDGKVEEITFEVGIQDPERLEEGPIDLDAEVALARRRTIRKDLRPGSTVADVLASAPPMPVMPSVAPTANAIANSSAAVLRGHPVPPFNESSTQTAAESTVSLDDSTTGDVSLEEASEFFDGPYSHTQPRSRTSLYRSATAVAANRQRNPQASRIIQQAQVRYRRPGDRTELPHESDADNWVPPPPPYTAESDRLLPEELRRTLLPRNTDPLRHTMIARERPRRASTTYESPNASPGSRRISSLPHRPTMALRQRSSEAAAPNLQTHITFPDSTSQRSDAVSPVSTAGFNFGFEVPQPSEPSIASRNTSSASSRRRPMSAVVGRMAGSLRTSSTPRLTSPVATSSQSTIPHRQAPSHSISLPPSPNRLEQPQSPLTLTGANLQQRLEYPLPPAPNNANNESLSRRDLQPTAPSPAARPEPSAYQQMQADNLAAAGMPSAQQLANLNNRTRQAPLRRQVPPGIVTAHGYPIPAPPRGALGAAGSPTSSPLHSPSRSLSIRNSFARSSPALLRPTPRRLDTIESVSSFISRSRTRSKSRDVHPTMSRNSNRRSRSVGPTFMPDRVPMEQPPPLPLPSMKKGWLSKKGRRMKGREAGDVNVVFPEERSPKGGKCVVM